jgi:hypothetical protein
MGTMFSGLEVEIFKTTPQEATFFALNQERNLKIGVIACKSAFFVSPKWDQYLLEVSFLFLTLGMTLNIFQILIILMPRYLQES